MIAHIARQRWILFSFMLASVIAVLAPAGNIFAASQSSGTSQGQLPYSGSAKCPSPPVGWNPATATVAELRFYGLPLPHASSEIDYNRWLDQMRHSVTRLCGNEVKGPNHPEHYTTASNGNYWDGYVGTLGGFNSAQGSWTVPCYTGSNSSQRALEWVGIGGYGSRYLWQAGTESDYQEGYRFWYEDLDTTTGQSPIIYAGPAASCYDSVSIYIDYNLSVSGHSYVYMSNYTKNQYWSKSISFQPSSNSAEWILERTSCRAGNNYALAPISQVVFSNAYAGTPNYNGDAGSPISVLNPVSVTMYQNGVDLADDSGLYSGGTNFVDYFHNSGISYC